MSITIGIDFGTTKSIVGAWVDGKPFIIPCSNGRLSIPSEILVQGQGSLQEIFVGWDTRKKNKYSKDSFLVNAIKRNAGKSNYSKEKWWYVYPQYTISYILAELKCMAEEFFNQDITDAVIAIPSHFDLNQRRAIREAGVIAGLNVIRLLNEASASAMLYSIQYPEEQVLMVIDIGGGTTDIALLEVNNNILDVLNIEGNTNIGGIDYNNVLHRWFLEQLNNSFDIRDSEINKTTEQIIKDEIERMKIELSENKSSSIYLPWLSINGQFLHKEFVLTQADFKKLSVKVTNEISKLIIKTLASCNRKIDACLFLGGASNTYGLKEKVFLTTDNLPVPRRIEKTSVAKGAIIQAAIFNKEIQGLILDCLQASYGIGLQNDTYDILLNKNETIPVTKIKEFSTSEDNQTEIIVKLYKGENKIASKNKYIGNLSLKKLPPLPKGTLVINVKIEVNANMDFSITAEIKGRSDLNVETSLKSEFGLPHDLILDMQKKIELWKSKRKLQLS